MIAIRSRSSSSASSNSATAWSSPSPARSRVTVGKSCSRSVVLLAVVEDVERADVGAHRRDLQQQVAQQEAGERAVARHGGLVAETVVAETGEEGLDPVQAAQRRSQPGCLGRAGGDQGERLGVRQRDATHAVGQALQEVLPPVASAGRAPRRRSACRRSGPRRSRPGGPPCPGRSGRATSPRPRDGCPGGASSARRARTPRCGRGRRARSGPGRGPPGRTGVPHRPRSRHRRRARAGRHAARSAAPLLTSRTLPAPGALTGGWSAAADHPPATHETASLSGPVRCGRPCGGSACRRGRRASSRPGRRRRRRRGRRCPGW